MDAFFRILDSMFKLGQLIISYLAYKKSQIPKTTESVESSKKNKASVKV